MFKFVQATESDKVYLLELRKKTMLKNLEKAGQLLTEEEHLDRLNYKFEYSHLIFHKKELIGVLKYSCTCSEVEIIQMQIDPKYQNMGYGSGIVQQLLNNEKGKTVKLAVLKKSRAVEFYMRLGFQRIGEDDYEYQMQNKH